MILLANKALGAKEGGQPLLGGLDVTVDRNHFGSQSQSFETEVATPILGQPMHGIFIRAPAIVQAGDNVEVDAHRCPDPYSRGTCHSHKGKQDSHCCCTPGHHSCCRLSCMLVCFYERLSVQPELGQDSRLHQLFVEMVRQTKAEASIK
jgi:5'-phosphate synthase pdxT subunit